MGRKETKGSRQKEEVFERALQGKQIPVLTLDSKWYRLLDELGRSSVKSLEEQLNTLLKRQGKLNTETKDIRKLKKKLMNEIVEMADEADQTGDRKLEKKLAEHRRLVEECSAKLAAYQDELIEIPREIDRINIRLMTMTMEYCYDAMQENTEEIREISDWVTGVRIELKKRLIRKQEMEQRNREIYSYMHDIFGSDVVDLFDVQFQPEAPRPAGTPQTKGDRQPEGASRRTGREKEPSPGDRVLEDLLKMQAADEAAKHANREADGENRL